MPDLNGCSRLVEICATIHLHAGATACSLDEVIHRCGSEVFATKSQIHDPSHLGLDLVTCPCARCLVMCCLCRLRRLSKFCYPRIPLPAATAVYVPRACPPP